MDSGMNVSGTRVYRDQTDTSRFYLVPPPLQVARDASGRPEWTLSLYRYSGRKGTGDAALFRAYGVLSVQVEQSYTPEQIEQIKHALIALGHSSPQLANLSVESTHYQPVSGALSQEWKREGMRHGASLQLVLSPETASLLWQAFDAQQAPLSIEVRYHVSGVSKNEKEWVSKTGVLTSIVALEFGDKEGDSHLSRQDLDAQMNRAYTEWDVLCFDFIENIDPDLYSKTVEIRLRTSGRPLIKTVRFAQDSDYRERIRFPLARELDQAYAIRVTRVYKDGRKETTGWIPKRNDLMLDITDYEPIDSKKDD
jgi:hypothetical protein